MGILNGIEFNIYKIVNKIHI